MNKRKSYNKQNVKMVDEETQTSDWKYEFCE